MSTLQIHLDGPTGTADCDCDCDCDWQLGHWGPCPPCLLDLLAPHGGAWPAGVPAWAGRSLVLQLWDIDWASVQSLSWTVDWSGRVDWVAGWGWLT